MNKNEKSPFPTLIINVNSYLIFIIIIKQFQLKVLNPGFGEYLATSNKGEVSLKAKDLSNVAVWRSEFEYKYIVFELVERGKKLPWALCNKNNTKWSKKCNIYTIYQFTTALNPIPFEWILFEVWLLLLIWECPGFNGEMVGVTLIASNPHTKPTIKGSESKYSECVKLKNF